MLKEPPTEPRQEPPMMRDYRLAAVVAVVLIVALLAAACAASRQAQGAVGSATPEPAMATRIAAAQTQAGATRQAVATSAADFDATAGAQNTATAAAQTALMNATVSPAATTLAEPTPLAATAVPKPTTRPEPTSIATPGAPTYTADFANWDSGVKGAPYPARLSYDGATKEYHIALTDAGRAYTYQTYMPEARYFADFRLTVDVHRVAGPASGGGYGVLFRALPQTPKDNVSPDLAFLVRPQEQSFALNQLSANGSAKNLGKGTMQIIKAGDAVNHLEVIAQGNRITLGVNGTTVGTYSATMTQAGAVGLVVSSPPAPTGTIGMEAAFSNLHISPLPVATPTAHQ